MNACGWDNVSHPRVVGPTRIVAALCVEGFSAPHRMPVFMLSSNSSNESE